MKEVQLNSQKRAISLISSGAPLQGADGAARDHLPVPPRLGRIEGWLRKVIRTFQDPQTRPDIQFDNLTDLSSPTQLYGVAHSHRGFYRAALLVTHMTTRPNGQVIVVSVAGLGPLAQFAPIADIVFGTGDLKHQFREELSRFGDPERRMGEVLCLSLAARIRGEPTPAPPGSGAAAPSRSMLQTDPPGALWDMTWRGKLQPPDEFIMTLGRPRTSAEPPAKAENRETPIPPPVKHVGFGAYNEPVVWFGEAPFPSIPDLILDAPRTHDNRLVARGTLDGVDAFVYNTGLAIMLTPDRHVARSLLNQFFAVLSRSGVPALALPDGEVIEITAFDKDSASIGGSSMAVTRRNRLSGPSWEASPLSFHQSFVVDESAAANALTVADACATDERLRELALRFFDAVTLEENENHTEAFVVGWSLIETHIQSIFVRIWSRLGFSAARIKDMARDWTASHNIDLLVAVGEIEPKEAADLHVLRRKRNKIVHELQGATEQDARDCLGRASNLIALPYLADLAVRPARL